MGSNFCNVKTPMTLMIRLICVALSSILLGLSCGSQNQSSRISFVGVKPCSGVDLRYWRIILVSFLVLAFWAYLLDTPSGPIRQITQKSWPIANGLTSMKKIKALKRATTVTTRNIDPKHPKQPFQYSRVPILSSDAVRGLEGSGCPSRPSGWLITSALYITDQGDQYSSTSRKQKGHH